MLQNFDDTQKICDGAGKSLTELRCRGVPEGGPSEQRGLKMLKIIQKLLPISDYGGCKPVGMGEKRRKGKFSLCCTETDKALSIQSKT